MVVYCTDRGIEELDARRGEEEVTLGWLATRLQSFVDLHPEFDVPVDRLATWLARADDEDCEGDAPPAAVTGDALRVRDSADRR